MYNKKIAQIRPPTPCHHEGPKRSPSWEAVSTTVTGHTLPTPQGGTSTTPRCTAWIAPSMLWTATPSTCSSRRACVQASPDGWASGVMSRSWDRQERLNSTQPGGRVADLAQSKPQASVPRHPPLSPRDPSHQCPSVIQWRGSGPPDTCHSGLRALETEGYSHQSRPHTFGRAFHPQLRGDRHLGYPPLEWGNNKPSPILMSGSGGRVVCRAFCV